MIKHKFKLETVADGAKNVMALQIHRCNQPGVPDEWQQYILDPDELDDLRRLLNVGMGDCDHCEDAGIMQRWREAQCKPKEKVISHDMTRLKEHELWLVGHKEMIDAHGKRLDGYDLRFVELNQKFIDNMKRVEWRLDHNEDETLINNDGYHALAKCIDDLRVELERVKTDMSVMKFAFTTHMGVSHAQDKPDAAHKP